MRLLVVLDLAILIKRLFVVNLMKRQENILITMLLQKRSHLVMHSTNLVLLEAMSYQMRDWWISVTILLLLSNLLHFWWLSSEKDLFAGILMHFGIPLRSSWVGLSCICLLPASGSGSKLPQHSSYESTTVWGSTKFGYYLPLSLFQSLRTLSLPRLNRTERQWFPMTSSQCRILASSPKPRSDKIVHIWIL